MAIENQTADDSPILTLRQFLLAVVSNPMKDDPRFSAQTLRRVMRDWADHAEVLYNELNHED